jgi:RNA polymerase sigma-70 factor (ECF subfamily)
MDRELLAAIVTAHQTELYRYARYLGADPAAAEDLVQETFLTAFETVMPPETAEPRVRAAWLRGVLRNLFLRYCHRRHAGPILSGADFLEKAEAVWKSDFLRAGDGFDYIESLRKCLQSLPERQRKALDLQYAQKKSRSEIARLFAMTEDGIKSFMRRIRLALADCIRKRIALEET